MRTEKEIRLKLKRLSNKAADWFVDPDGTERDYQTIRVLKWVLSTKVKGGKNEV